MKTVAIHIRVTPTQARQLKEAAKARLLTLASYVREAAMLAVETNPELRRFPVTAADHD